VNALTRLGSSNACGEGAEMREDRNAWREQARKVAAALRWRPRPLSLVGHGGGG